MGTQQMPARTFGLPRILNTTQAASLLVGKASPRYREQDAGC